MNLNLVPRPLTSEAFAPFGQVLNGTGKDPTFANDGGTKGWDYEFQAGKPVVMLLETPPGDLHVTSLEAHSHVSQTFIPAGGSPAVLIVAPATGACELPTADSAQAFLLDGSAGYILSVGTWHSLDRLPLTDEATRWIMITDEETHRDLPLVSQGRAEHTRQIDLAETWGRSVSVIA